jgi:hypothetical protein
MPGWYAAGWFETSGLRFSRHQVTADSSEILETVLRLPKTQAMLKDDKEFTLNPEASDHAIRAVLSQKGEEHAMM